MTSGYPAAVVTAPPTQLATAPSTRKTAAPEIGAWRYHRRRSSRLIVLLAAAVSAGIHGGLLLGIGPPRKKVAARPADDAAFMIRLTVPDIKELEEPEPVATDDAPPPDLGILVPMQADVPQLARPTDFVQQINFASLVEQPDFSKLQVYAVPEHIRTTGKLSEQLGKIFNLADLDRSPEPVLQPPPQFPIAMRREAQDGTVAVEFIVDTQGRVLEPVVIESTHHGFDDAALAGVSRWKFKPGYKNGRKVNTRMRVPIVFKLLDPTD